MSQESQTQAPLNSPAAPSNFCRGSKDVVLQVNLDMTDSMGPGKLDRHMQNLSYIYDEYLICIGLGPSISSVICKNPSYSGPSYPSSPVLDIYVYNHKFTLMKLMKMQFGSLEKIIISSPAFQFFLNVLETFKMFLFNPSNAEATLVHSRGMQTF